MSTIPLATKVVEVFFREHHIPSEISHHSDIFGVTDIIDNQYVVRTTGYFSNSIFDEGIINAVTSISIEIWYRRIVHLDYQNILRLHKIADGIDINEPITGEICGDCRKKR